MGEAEKISAEKMLQHIFDDVVWLDIRWRTYVSMFGQEEARVQALNRRTGHTFGLMQRVLIDAVILDAAKLLSREKSAGHNVVSLGGAIRALPATVSEELQAQLTERFTKLREKHAMIIAHRDQRIAHNDWAIATNVETLAGVSRDQIRTAIDDVMSLLNAISNACHCGQFALLEMNNDERITKVLLKILELGNEEIDRRNEAKRARFKELFGVESKRDDPLDEWNPDRHAHG